MKKAQIEIGKEYAAGAPNRSEYWYARVARVKVLGVGVYGLKFDTWGHGRQTERENYVLVEDLSDKDRTVVKGEYGQVSIERELGWRNEITAKMDKRVEGYYAVKAARATESLWSGEKKIAVIPYSWILESWATFEPKAVAKITAEAKAAEDADEAEKRSGDLADELKELGVTSARRMIGGILISNEDAEKVRDKLLELEGLRYTSEE